MMETASDAMKPVTWGAPRMGRKAALSMARPTNAPAARTQTDTSQKGQPNLKQPEGHEGADHDHVAVGEVDQPDDPVDHGETDGHQRIHAAQDQAVDDLLAGYTRRS
jgi:hypothetical protein